MVGRNDTPAQLFVVGANHHSSSIMLRDELFVPDGAVPEVLRALKAKGVPQAIVLSTCDRVEVQAAAPEPAKAAEAVIAVLTGRVDKLDADAGRQFYTLAGDDAARHIFAVAASLDSQVIGEPQVLGQVKAGHKLAKSAGMVGSELDGAVQAAFAVAKQIRTETAIGEAPVSMAAAAVQVARDLHGALTKRSALLLGDGEMGELTAEQLRSAGLGRLTVSLPSPARGQAAARRLDCHEAPFETLPALLDESDIVLAALGGRSYTVGAEMIEAALDRRRRRPILLIDAGVPGDIDPAVERIDDAFRFSLDDLERVALSGRARREDAAHEAWSILEAGLAEYQRGRLERGAVPAIEGLRAHFEAVRREVLDEAGGGDAEAVSRRLINRLLHEPSTELRAIAAEDGNARAQETASLLDRLFGIGRGAGASKSAAKVKKGREE
ncbi:MAG: glutamyl-tRNA reductase [Alphaproteobacteria bacterium]|nr:glutamyl-tRNA reductase [Alphaproteobacteria bacterium]